MAIKYNTNDVYVITFNGNDVNKLIKDSTTIWCKPFNLTKSVGSNVASAVVTRTYTEEPSATTTTLDTGTHNIFYGDTLTTSGTAAEGYTLSISPSGTITVDSNKTITFSATAKSYTVTGSTSNGTYTTSGTFRYANTVTFRWTPGSDLGYVYTFNHFYLGTSSGSNDIKSVTSGTSTTYKMIDGGVYYSTIYATLVYNKTVLTSISAPTAGFATFNTGIRNIISISGLNNPNDAALTGYVEWWYASGYSGNYTISLSAQETDFSNLHTIGTLPQYASTDAYIRIKLQGANGYESSWYYLYSRSAA